MIIPKGVPKPTNSGSYMGHNEYIVYNMNQARIRYVLRMNMNGSWNHGSDMKWKFKDKINFIDVYLYTFNGISINLISFLSQLLEELTHSYSIVTNIIVVLGCICLL